MKTTFRHNIRAKNKRKKILIGVLIALILTVIVFRDFSFGVLSRPIFYILRPVLKIKSDIGEWKDSVISEFADKNFLAEENKSLRGKISEMDAKIALLENLEKENNALKSAFSSEDLSKWRKDNKFILASIIYKPPSVPFDSFVIDSGSESGIKEGMLVSAFGNILLGYTEEVFSSTSKIKLISSFGEETNVVIESSQTPAIAIGRGSENLEITLPKAIDIKEREKIMTLGKQPFFTGFIERIERSTEDPFQKIIFRLPVNIQQLKEVLILRK